MDFNHPELIKEHINNFCKTIKMKLLDFKAKPYINLTPTFTKNIPKCKIVDHVQIPRYNNVSAKGYILEGYLVRKSIDSDVGPS